MTKCPAVWETEDSLLLAVLDPQSGLLPEALFAPTIVRCSGPTWSCARAAVAPARGGQVPELAVAGP